MKPKQLDDTIVLDDMMPDADEKEAAVWVSASEEKEKITKHLNRKGGMPDG